MAKAKKTIFPSTPAEDRITPAKLKAFFDSLNSNIITSVTVDGNYVYIEIDETVTLKWNGSASEAIKMIFNGTESTVSNCNSFFNARGGTITVIWSDDFMVIKSKNNYDNTDKVTFIYEKLNESSYFGMINSLNMNGITMLNTDDGLNYVHQARLNYAAEVEKIDVTSDILFQGGYKALEDEQFLACSTISEDQVITFNGKNYYSLGANILVPLDDI